MIVEECFFAWVCFFFSLLLFFFFWWRGMVDCDGLSVVMSEYTVSVCYRRLLGVFLPV